MKKILLNTTPPGTTTTPSPGLSSLKGHLTQEGHYVDIMYWNILLEDLKKDFFNFSADCTFDAEYNLLPYNSYLAIEHQDKNLQNKIASTVLNYKPELINLGLEYILEELQIFHDKLDILLDQILSNINLEGYNYIGFTTLFNQWIVSNIIARKIKTISPKTHLIAGGFGNKKMALSFLNNFSDYDFAIWGEGEVALSQLMAWNNNLLSNIGELENIPNLVYKIDEVVHSNSITDKFIDLNNLVPDYSDFFKQKKHHISEANTSIPIEGGRGCHWNRCRFCFLNSGYKFRVKSPETITQEIRSNINKYEILEYSFLDNDIIGEDLDRFEKLLDLLIELKREYKDFKIIMAEIITKNITKDIIKKMFFAGFTLVQIGYENPSNNLLTKIRKKNTFASNMFFLKWAIYYKVEFTTLFIIRNMLEETDDDILEATSNLYFLRFYYSKIESRMTLLHISQSSRYHKVIENNGELGEWKFSSTTYFLPNNYIKKEDSFSLIMDHSKTDYNCLWDNYESVESHFKRNIYDYQLINRNGVIYYIERLNNEIINEHFFEIGKDIGWDILVLTNDKIHSLESLMTELNVNDHSLVIHKIKELHSLGLLYSTIDNKEIVSVINLDNISL